MAITVVSLSIIKAYSNYKIEQTNKNLRLRRWIKNGGLLVV